MSKYFNNNNEIIIKNSGDNLILTKNTCYDKSPIIDIMENLQIGFYYWNPKHPINEEIIIPLYLTDLNQIEDRRDDYSEIFKLRLDVDGNISYIDNLHAGDVEISLGFLPEGMHYFSVQIEDQYGRTSNRIFNEIWCINPDSYRITRSQTYIITDNDLDKFKIKKNNSSLEQDMTNTRAGLTALLAEIKNKGYRKAVLPYGTYRINRAPRYDDGKINNRPILMPSNFTLDLNKSTIKLNPYDDRDCGGIGKVTNVSVEFNKCIDSHLINGTLEGDYAERLQMIVNGQDAAVYSNGEGNQSVYFWGGRYNSLENITFKQLTGYMISTMYSDTFENPIHSTNYTTNKYLNIDGSIVDKEGYSISDFVDISDYKNNRIQINRYLGYGGFAGDDVCYNICFYDTNKKLIDGFKAMQFRSLIIPKGAKFIKFSCKFTNNENLAIFAPDTPRYCEVINCDFIDNKTCVAPAKFQHLIMKNITFTRSGQRLTPSAIDIEDGWEEGQDLFLQNIRVIEQSGTCDIICDSGMNLVFKNITNARVSLRNRMCGFVVKNCNLDRVDFSIDGISSVKNHYYKIDNSVIDNLTTSNTNNNDPKSRKIYFSKNSIAHVINNSWGCIYPVKNNIMLSNDPVYKDIGAQNLILEDSDIYINETMNTNNVIFRNCNFYINPSYDKKNKFINFRQNYETKAVFENCTFDLEELHFNYTYYYYEFNNCTFNCILNNHTSTANYKKKLIFNHCTFNNRCDNTMYYNEEIIMKQCTFNDKVSSAIYGNSILDYYGCDFRLYEDETNVFGKSKIINRFDCTEGTAVTSLPKIDGLICYLDAFDLNGTTTWIDRMGNYNAILEDFDPEALKAKNGLLQCRYDHYPEGYHGSSYISIPTIKNFKSIYICFQMHKYSGYSDTLMYNGKSILNYRYGDNYHYDPSSIIKTKFNQKGFTTSSPYNMGYGILYGEGVYRNIYYEFVDVDSKSDVIFFKNAGDATVAYIMLFDRALTEREVELLYAYHKKLNKTRG